MFSVNTNKNFMWLRNLPKEIKSQKSGHDNLNFLWNLDNLYVMDNHLGAAWCWMQQCDANTMYNFLHIDRHNDLGTNTPYEIYKCLRENPHLPLNEYTELEWKNDENNTHIKAFLWDNYISQSMKLFPKWFNGVVFSTRTALGRTEREKLLEADIHKISASELLSYIDNNIHRDECCEQLNSIIVNKPRKWIVNLDLDYFYYSDDNDCFQILTDEYIRTLAVKFRENMNQIQVLTIALSPECCGGWDNSIHALNVFMETFKEQNMKFPNDYL